MESTKDLEENQTNKTQFRLKRIRKKILSYRLRSRKHKTRLHVSVILIIKSFLIAMDPSKVNLIV